MHYERERLVGRKGVRFFKSKRKDKEMERKREERKEGANVYKRVTWKTLQWTLSLTLLKRAPFFLFFLRSSCSLKFSSTRSSSPRVLLLRYISYCEETIILSRRAHFNCVLSRMKHWIFCCLQIAWFFVNCFFSIKKCDNRIEKF